MDHHLLSLTICSDLYNILLNHALWVQTTVFHLPCLEELICHVNQENEKFELKKRCWKRVVSHFNSVPFSDAKTWKIPSIDLKQC
jgi:hypothetical protein